MKLPKFPKTLTEGHASVKIFRLTRPDGQPCFSVDWRINSARNRKAFRDYARAYAFGDALVKKLANEGTAALQLDSLDAAVYARCKALMPDGVSLDLAADVFAKAAGLVGVDAIIAACQDYKKHHQNMTAKPVAEAVGEYVAALEAAGRSQVHIQTQKRQLKSFADVFKTNVVDLVAEDVRQFLDSHQVGPTTKRNDLVRLRAFLNWCVQRKYLAKDHDLTSGIALPRRPLGAIGILTPGQAKVILDAASEKLRPCLAIAFFAGPRTAELLRLGWENVNLQRGFIEFAATKTKTQQRRLTPISANLAAWLAPFADRTGPIWPDTQNEYHRAVRRTCRAVNVTWPSNAARHSYVSYRVAATGDVARTALEAGNSPKEIFQSYRELCTPDEAKEWFAIAPPAPAENVINLQSAAVA